MVNVIGISENTNKVNVIGISENTNKPNISDEIIEKDNIVKDFSHVKFEKLMVVTNSNDFVDFDDFNDSDDSQ